MTSPGSNVDLNIAGFAARLIEVSGTAERARIIAQTVVDIFPEATAILYVLQEDDDRQFWAVKATSGDGAEPDRRVPVEAGTLDSLVKLRHSLLTGGATLARQEYDHFNI